MTPIVIDLYGKIYLGSYEFVDKQSVRVSSVGLGSKLEQIGNSDAGSVARTLLRVLVREAQARNAMIEQEAQPLSIAPGLPAGSMGGFKTRPVSA